MECIKILNAAILKTPPKDKGDLFLSYRWTAKAKRLLILHGMFLKNPLIRETCECIFITHYLCVLLPKTGSAE